MSKPDRFDVAVIGGGPGGYPAAIKCAQMGLSVALIEKEFLGGTCLNWGCIPTKALIANAHTLEQVRRAEEFGITTGPVSFDFSKMAGRKDEVVKKVRKSLGQLIKSNKIHLFEGFGEFLSPSEIKVTGKDSGQIMADQVIVSTGSYPLDLPAFPCDGKRILDSNSILGLTELPKSLAIIGGGVIGCEFASLYNAFGVEVTILEAMPRLISIECESVSNALLKAFQEQGINCEFNVFVEGIDASDDGVVVKLAGGQEHRAELALVSVGRALNTRDMGLEKAGVHVENNGTISVDDKMETSVPGVYAIGDITGKAMLAHVASHQGLVAASNVAGKPAHMHYNAVPSVIFTMPEIATVGMTLEQATNEGYKAKIGAFPFQALGKSQAAMQTEGFAQVVVDRDTGQILGAQVVGHEAATLIAEITVAISAELTIESVTDTIHAHPTIAEVWLEAAMMAQESPLHLPPKRKRKEAASAR